jgi:hypothetical protein
MLSGADNSERLEMQLGEPQHIEPQLLGGVDLFHRLVEGFTVAPTRERRKLVKHAEFHNSASFTAPRMPAAT